MTFNQLITRKCNALRVLALAVAGVIGLPALTASAQQLSGYGEVEPRAVASTASGSSAQSNLDRDRVDLINARHRADELAAQRDEQQRTVDSLRDGQTTAPATSSAPSSTASSADVQALQRQFDDAKARADRIHDDAVARFEQSEAWKSEFAKFDQARKDLKGPTDTVLNQLSQTHDFQDLVSAAKAAKERADRLHEDKNADPKAVREADDAFVAADNRVQEAAERALRADPRVADDRKVVDAAKARLDEMRDKFERDLINDPQFGPAVAEVRAKQDALDAATGRTTPSDPQLAASTDVPPSPEALRDAQARLDQLNRDLDDARAEVDRLTVRVRDDERAMGLADSSAPTPDRGYAPQAPDDGYDTAPPPADQGGYDYGGYVAAAEPVPYAVPVYTPAVAVDAYDWWSPGLSFGISLGCYHYHDYWCNDWYGRWCRPAYYYGGYHGFDGYFGYYDHYRHGGYYGGYYGRGDYYGRGGYGYHYDGGRSYAGRDYGRGSRGGYYEGSRYGRGYGSSYSSSGYSSGRSAYDSRAAYENRVNRRYDNSLAAHQSYEGRTARRYDDALAAHQSYEGRTTRRYDDALAARQSYEGRVERRAGAIANDYSGYRNRVERRAGNDASPAARTFSDRSAYESRVQRRATESSSPRMSRESAAGPSYRYQFSSPRTSQREAESRHSSSSYASPRHESSRGYSSSSSHSSSHESQASSESHHSSGRGGSEGGGGDHSGSSSRSSHGHSR